MDEPARPQPDWATILSNLSQDHFEMNGSANRHLNANKKAPSRKDEEAFAVPPCFTVISK
jgi:hypothetical protein